MVNTTFSTTAYIGAGGEPVLVGSVIGSTAYRSYMADTSVYVGYRL